MTVADMVPANASAGLQAGPPSRARSRLSDFLRSSPLARWGLALTLLLLAAALFAPWIAPHPPDAQDLPARLLAPGWHRSRVEDRGLREWDRSSNPTIVASTALRRSKICALRWAILGSMPASHASKQGMVH